MSKYWDISFKTLQQKQDFAASQVAKILTLCLNAQLKTDAEIVFSFDGTSNFLHASYVCKAKKGDQMFSRRGERVILFDDIADTSQDAIINYESAISCLEYLLINRIRKGR